MYNVLCPRRRTVDAAAATEEPCKGLVPCDAAHRDGIIFNSNFDSAPVAVFLTHAGHYTEILNIVKR